LPVLFRIPHALPCLALPRSTLSLARVANTGLKGSRSLAPGRLGSAVQEVSMRIPSFPRWSRSLVGLIALALALGACAFGASTTSAQNENPTTNAATAVGSTPTSQPVAQQGTTCPSLSGFSGAQAATAGSGFGDVSFPSNSISTSIATSGGGAGRFTIKQFDVCTPATTTNGVYSFFSGSPTSGGMVGAGWAQATYGYKVEQVGRLPIPGRGEIDLKMFQEFLGRSAEQIEEKTDNELWPESTAARIGPIPEASPPTHPSSTGSPSSSAARP